MQFSLLLALTLSTISTALPTDKSVSPTVSIRDSPFSELFQSVDSQDSDADLQPTTCDIEETTCLSRITSPLFTCLRLLSNACIFAPSSTPSTPTIANTTTVFKNRHTSHHIHSAIDLKILFRIRVLSDYIFRLKHINQPTHASRVLNTQTLDILKSARSKWLYLQYTLRPPSPRSTHARLNAYRLRTIRSYNAFNLLSGLVEDAVDKIILLSVRTCSLARSIEWFETLQEMKGLMQKWDRLQLV